MDQRILIHQKQQQEKDNNGKTPTSTQKEKEEIKQNSKKLLTEFASILSKIKAPKDHIDLDNRSGIREEGTGWKTDQEFRSTMLSNAQVTDGNSIIAEKGAWKK